MKILTLLLFLLCFAYSWGKSLENQRNVFAYLSPRVQERPVRVAAVAANMPLEVAANVPLEVEAPAQPVIPVAPVALAVPAPVAPATESLEVRLQRYPIDIRIKLSLMRAAPTVMFAAVACGAVNDYAIKGIELTGQDAIMYSMLILGIFALKALIMAIHRFL